MVHFKFVVLNILKSAKAPSGTRSAKVSAEETVLEKETELEAVEVGVRPEDAEVLRTAAVMAPAVVCCRVVC